MSDIDIQQDYLVIPGFAAPGCPAVYNRLGVLRWRAAAVKPRAVLVLSPGFTAGAGIFRHLGASIVSLFRGDVAVWSVDRRQNLLDDRTGFLRAAAAEDPVLAMNYYLQQDRRALQDRVPFMQHWGLETALEDLRCVLRRARKTHPDAKLLLGGHSLGGMTAQCYAAAEFTDRQLGETDIDGLVLIDGMVRGEPFIQQFHEQSISAYARIDAGEYYWDDWDRFVSPTVAILAEIAAAEVRSPDSGPSKLQAAIGDAPGAAAAIVRALTGGRLVTGRALFGLMVGDQTSPSDMARAHVGRLQDGGDEPLGWLEQDGPGLESLLGTYAAILEDCGFTDGLEWHSPVRLNADLDALQHLDSGRLPDALKERAPQLVKRNRSVSLPVLAFANLDHPNTHVQSYEWYRDSIRSKSFRLETAPGYAHMDPLIAPISSNEFLDSLGEWLRESMHLWRGNE